MRLLKGTAIDQRSINGAKDQYTLTNCLMGGLNL